MGLPFEDTDEPAGCLWWMLALFVVAVLVFVTLLG
jgi:hypothetical protein